jgi:hypothetical protein
MQQFDEEGTQDMNPNYACVHQCGSLTLFTWIRGTSTKLLCCKSMDMLHKLHPSGSALGQARLDIVKILETAPDIVTTGDPPKDLNAPLRKDITSKLNPLPNYGWNGFTSNKTGIEPAKQKPIPSMSLFLSEALKIENHQSRKTFSATSLDIRCALQLFRNLGFIFLLIFCAIVSVFCINLNVDCDLKAHRWKAKFLGGFHLHPKRCLGMLLGTKHFITPSCANGDASLRMVTI